MRGEGCHRVPHLRSLSDALTAPPAARFRPDEINGAASNEICAAEINSTIVHLLRVHAGRAPTNAETVLTSELAVVTLRDCLTAAERTLADEGLSALAMEVRTALHEGIRAQATAVVEEITGLPVVAYLTAQQEEPDVSIIAFVFAPPAAPSGSRR